LAGICIFSAATHIWYPDGSGSVIKLHGVTSQKYSYFPLSDNQILLSLLLSFERGFEQKGQLRYRRRNGKTKVRGMAIEWRNTARVEGRKEGYKMDQIKLAEARR
jgi:hypothetical protein